MALPQVLEPTTPNDWIRSDQYHNSFLLQRDIIVAKALENSREHGLPEIQHVSAAMGKFLHLQARSIGAKRILEVGTLGGYSAVWMSQALPDDGRLVTLELDPARAAVATENLSAAGLSSKVKVIVGPALESMIAMHLSPDELFDFVFIDADKTGNKDYFIQAKRLVRKGGVIIVDNVVRHGLVAKPGYTDPSTEGVRALLEAVQGDSEVEATTIGTVGEKGYDGFMYMIRQ